MRDAVVEEITIRCRFHEGSSTQCAGKHIRGPGGVLPHPTPRGRLAIGPLAEIELNKQAVVRSVEDLARPVRTIDEARAKAITFHDHALTGFQQSRYIDRAV